MAKGGRRSLNAFNSSFMAQMDPSGHNITFTRIYNNHGPVRVKLNTNKPVAKLPSVQQLISQLTKKHEKIRVSDVSGDKGTNNIRYGYIHKDNPDPELGENSHYSHDADHRMSMSLPQRVNLSDSLTSLGDTKSTDDIMSAVRRPVLHKEPHILHQREATTVRRETQSARKETRGHQREPPALCKEAPLTSSVFFKDAEKNQTNAATKIQEIVERISPRRDQQEKADEVETSSATPSGGPYSSTDIVSYSNDVGNRHISNEEFRHNNLADTDRDRDRRKSNGHERRPNSLNTSPKSLKTETKVTNIERPGREREQDWDNLRQSQQFEREFTKDKERTLNVDRIPLPDDRDDIKPSNNKAAVRPNYFKPIGARNNFVTNRDPQIIATHQINIHQHTRSQSGPSREPEDLVAMGTIWNPNNVPVQKNGNNSKSFNVSNPTATQINVNSLNPALTMSRKYPTSRISQLAHNSGNNKKEADPRYSDPIIGAPASFQQRLVELAALESETVRWERNRKFKKKKQQDTS
ncbi:uncharacterized protein LOC135486260 isoform X2 [Lineus longissimus]|uniref:uncharacterized protein LOC135486260 isoform X2 n=1 Tax=Lineus longissimus TaxID=88925 RepID=UPI00315DED96